MAWLRYDQANSAPWRARLYSDALHFLAGIPSVKDPVYLVVAEAGGLVNDDPGRQVAGVAVLGEPNASAHCGPPLIARGGRVVAGATLAQGLPHASIKKPHCAQGA